MILAIVSDTHRYKFAISKVLQKIKHADILIHLGDNVEDLEAFADEFPGKIINVSGNCDFSPTVKSERIEIIEEQTIFITHGHKYDVKYGINNLKEKAINIGANIVLYGHTHVSKVDYDEGVWFINPGSPSLPRDGFASIAIIEINKGKVNPTILKL